jgi:regulatory protein
MKRRSPLDDAGWGGASAAAFGALDAARGEPVRGRSLEEQRENAEKLLLQRLRTRSLSVAEARAVLGGTEIGDGDAEEIIQRFSELHYLDERKLADQIMRSHHERKGLGRTAVEAEMRRRRLAHDVMLEKLDELPDDEAARAAELAGKRMQQLDRLDDETADRRLTGYLMRKGYSSQVVRAAVKEAMATRARGGGTSAVRFR